MDILSSNSTNQQETVAEMPKIIDNPNRKSLKVWCEKSQRYYHKSRDPNYYKDYFHKTKREMACEYCGRTVTCQMYSHRKSQYCINKRKELEEQNASQNTDQ